MTAWLLVIWIAGSPQPTPWVYDTEAECRAHLVVPLERDGRETCEPQGESVPIAEGRARG